jgi:hypothetical protein
VEGRDDVSMPNVSLIPTFNVSNYTDAFSGVFSYSAESTGGFAGAVFLSGMWLVVFLSLQQQGRVNAGIAASLLCTFLSFLLLAYSAFVPLNFCYLMVALLLTFILLKAFEGD